MKQPSVSTIRQVLDAFYDIAKARVSGTPTPDEYDLFAKTLHASAEETRLGTLLVSAHNGILRAALEGRQRFGYELVNLIRDCMYIGYRMALVEVGQPVEEIISQQDLDEAKLYARRGPKSNEEVLVN
jgi:hypothetical protein